MKTITTLKKNSKLQELCLIKILRLRKRYYFTLCLSIRFMYDRFSKIFLQIELSYNELKLRNHIGLKNNLIFELIFTSDRYVKSSLVLSVSSQQPIIILGNFSIVKYVIRIIFSFFFDFFYRNLWIS